MNTQFQVSLVKTIPCLKMLPKMLLEPYYYFFPNPLDSDDRVVNSVLTIPSSFTPLKPCYWNQLIQTVKEDLWLVKVESVNTSTRSAQLRGRTRTISVFSMLTVMNSRQLQSSGNLSQRVLFPVSEKNPFCHWKLLLKMVQIRRAFLTYYSDFVWAEQWWMQNLTVNFKAYLTTRLSLLGGKLSSNRT